MKNPKPSSAKAFLIDTENVLVIFHVTSEVFNFTEFTEVKPIFYPNPSSDESFNG